MDMKAIMEPPATPSTATPISRPLGLPTELRLDILTRVVHDLVPTIDDVCYNSQRTTRSLVNRYFSMPFLRVCHRLRNEVARDVAVALEQGLPAIKRWAENSNMRARMRTFKIRGLRMEGRRLQGKVAQSGGFRYGWISRERCEEWSGRMCLDGARNARGFVAQWRKRVGM
ncbi:hypothetical protein B0A48_11143 [Cryoendolithus antarcticus]|uniref:Uncharacterized protein n=1 Tax=Cryoendolithus antarcticus TaxID=1507870 RepID=A0A1V8SUY3_9PEZI|nr:hypothetical protein B0A48_11143 [Cryoendolithus antarcticus]